VISVIDSKTPVLGVESSCDETGVAVYAPEGGLLAHALYSQVALHAEYGGVVPELASRDHVRKLLPLLRQTLAAAGLGVRDLGAVAYTAGPGLIGALLVGAAVARSLAWAPEIPAIEVHHMDPADPRRYERLGLGNRIVAVGDTAGCLTLAQTDDAAGANIDCWEEIH